LGKFVIVFYPKRRGKFPCRRRVLLLSCEESGMGDLPIALPGLLLGGRRPLDESGCDAYLGNPVRKRLLL